MKTFMRIILLVLVITAVSCRSSQLESVASDEAYAELVEQADVIFVGRVDYISAANPTMQQQQIAFSVLETILDGVNIGSGVVLTMDQALIVEENGEITSVPVSELTIGDELIVFANQKIVETAGGKTAVLTPIASNNGFIATEARANIISKVQQ